jgi:hypothetical protein
MDPNLPNIEKLYGLDNYTTWRIQITHLLKKEKLWKIINGVEAKPTSTTAVDGIVTNPPNTSVGSIAKWEEKDENAISILIENIKNVCLGHITYDIARENWEQLAKVFQNKDVMNKCYLRKKYINFQMKDGEDVINHIHSFKLLLEELATVGINYNEEDKVETLLASLPESYETRVQSLTNIADLTIEDVIFKILHEDLRRKKSGTSTSHSDVPTMLWTGKKSFNQRYSTKFNQSGYSKQKGLFNNRTFNHNGSISGFSGSNTGNSQMGYLPSSN